MLLENYPIVRQLLETVGLSVFHTLWAGGLLLLLLMLVLRVMPTQLAKARFAVSLAALQLLFLLFLGMLFHHWNQITPASLPVVSIATVPMPSAPVVLPSVSAAAEVNDPPAGALWVTRLHQCSPWLAMLWLLGGMFHAARLTLGMRHTRRLRTNAQPLPGDWENRLDRLKQRLRIRQPIAFRKSDQTSVPLTFGWLKPVVLIPASLLTQLSPEQLEMIVLHELAHICRHDYLWSLGQSVAEVVLFYHPAYWYIARMLEREREFACDQITVSLTQQPQTYARTLLQVATTNAPNYGLAVSGKRGLSDRIKRIVNPASGQSNGPVLPALVLIGILGIASATFAMQRHPFGSGDGPKAQEQLADSTDVDYGPSFEEVMAQVTDETLHTTSLTLDEIYGNAITIDQSLNQLDQSLKEYAASHPGMHKDQPVDSPVNYSSSEVLYLVDGQVRDPKSVRRSEVEEISVYRDLDKLTLEGIDLRGYSVMVTASSAKDKLTHPQDSSRSNQHLYLRNGWGKINPPPSNNAKSTNRWLYIVDEQIQTNRPTFLNEDYQAAGWETRIVPAAGWWIKAYLTKEQEALVDEDQYTGIVFITSQRYRATQPKHWIYGTVTKGQNERPLPGIPIRIAGKDTGTATDGTGYYQLAASSAQDTVVFSLEDHEVKVPISGQREVSLITHGTSAARKRKGEERMQERLKNMEERLLAESNSDSVLLIGQAYNWFTNQYIPDVQVVANDSVTTLTDADGRYQFRFPLGTKEVSLAFSAPGYPTRNMEIDMNGKERFHAVMSMVRENENAVIEALQTQPAQDSATTNTLIIIDGVPQYGKSWHEVNQALKQNPLYSHHTLTSHGTDSSQAILKGLRAKGYNSVVNINSWANLKKDGQVASAKLEKFLQVFPNPTQDWFTLQFSIGEELPVTLTILNNQGQPLTTLTDQTYPAGSHEVAWDASNRKPGVYFVQWTVGEQRVTRKVVIE